MLLVQCMIFFFVFYDIMKAFKTIWHHLLPKKVLSIFAGCMANITYPSIRNYLIRDFIQKYHVNMAEAIKNNPDDYSCFNDFFIRKLKTECRPINQHHIVSPVDGCISELGNINTGTIIQAKGKYYSVHALLACERSISNKFEHGIFATIYLSPKDYHRVHMPIDGTLTHMIHVPGRLFSVQPHTVQTVPDLFARNERLIAFFDTEIGPLAMVLVGATLVGAIGTIWHGDLKRPSKTQHIDCPVNPVNFLKKGQEMGYFKLGSTVILLFANAEKIQWMQEISANHCLNYGSALACLRTL